MAESIWSRLARWRPEQLDQLTASLGRWSLCETEPGRWPSHYADDLAAKEVVPAESLLAMDPLASISTAVAGKTWVWSLWCAGVILLVTVVIPRGFCGYVCPLGTLVDLADWLVGRRVRLRLVPKLCLGTHFREAPLRRGAARSEAELRGPGVPKLELGNEEWWGHLEYFLLGAILVAAAAGVLISGFVAAIPVVTRGLVFLLLPLQTGLARGWHQVPPLEAGHWVSIGLLAAVLGLGVLRPRFWCRYVCPTGATLLLVHFLRLTERRVDAACTQCGKCRAICPFDAVRRDATTRTANCAFCQTCGGVCPTGAISFGWRWQSQAPRPGLQPVGFEIPVGARRGFLARAIGGVAAVFAGAAFALIDGLGRASGRATARLPPVRPPGSVPEELFLRLCVRCGECLQACPNAALQPVGFGRGGAGLWTPELVADWSGCEPSCSNCGRVCPTGAIRPLPLEEKRACHVGLAVVNPDTCLPYAGSGACQLCVDECTTAGYEAIELVRVGTQRDHAGQPIEESGFLAPVVASDRCVGCGLCQTRCRAINVVQKELLAETAIRVEAGEGKEDRRTDGSYLRSAKRQSAHVATGARRCCAPARRTSIFLTR